MDDIIKCPHCGEETPIGSLIGADTNDCPRCGKRALPAARLLNEAQARGIADAMAHLNNIGGTLNTVIFNGNNAAVTVTARGAIGVIVTAMLGFAEVARESYATQAEFIRAYLGE